VVVFLASGIRLSLSPLVGENKPAGSMHDQGPCGTNPSPAHAIVSCNFAVRFELDSHT
jgi:hypothetical protein